MRKADVFKAWGRILTGRYPTLSIEITRECPLRCPGCYAYEPQHLAGTGQTLRSVADYKGQELVERLLDLVEKHKPLHLSLVGGEPLVRYRELSELLPKLDSMGIAVQVVTSAVRAIPPEWSRLKNLYLVVSVDGLQPEHDARRKPATYERILSNIEGHRVNIHCTLTSQTTGRQGYLEEFLDLWTPRAEVKKVWFSLFTPQIGSHDAETLTPDRRAWVIDELERLAALYPKLEMPKYVLAGFRKPPASPGECLFARTTLNLTANLTDKIAPCQFGGTPDCTQCGCIASAGLNAVGEVKFAGLRLRDVYRASDRIGKAIPRS